MFGPVIVTATQTQTNRLLGDELARRMDTRVIESIVDTALGGDVDSVQRPTEGSVADSWLLDLTGDVDFERVVCKRGGASVWTGDVIEPLVVDRVADRTDLPVPTVLAAGSLSETTAAEPDRWALYEHLDGSNPGAQYPDLDAAVRRQLVNDAGAALGRLHASSFEFVTGESATADPIGGLARWGSDLVLCEPDGWHAIDSALAREAPLTPVADDPACRPVFTHGDYQPGNLLVDDDGALTAVLDWGNAHVTHAGYAIARAEARFVDVHAPRIHPGERNRIRATFRAAYAAHAPLDGATIDSLRTYKFLWLVQSIANYGRIARSARGRAQLRRQFQTLLDRRT